MTAPGPKYGFTGREKKHLGRLLQEIIALRDFGAIKKGDVGGWVELEANLSQEGNCWLGPDCYAMDNSQISGNAILSGKNIRLWDSVQVNGNAILSGSGVQLSEDSQVNDSAILSGTDIRLLDGSQVNGKTMITAEKLKLRGDVKLSGQQILTGHDIELNEAPHTEYLMRPARLAKATLTHKVSP